MYNEFYVERAPRAKQLAGTTQALPAASIDAHHDRHVERAPRAKHPATASQARIRASITTFVLSALFFTTPLPAQSSFPPTTPQFREIVRLSQDGFSDSARGLASRALARMQRNDPLRPEALYTAATVAKTTQEMREDFSTILVEHPASAWADKALLRLMQLDYGAGNGASAVERTRRLFADYAESPVIPWAALWGARAAFEQKNPQQACDWLNRGLARVGDDVELHNQLDFAKQRCSLPGGVEYAPVVPESLRAKPEPITAPRSTPPDSVRSAIDHTATPASPPRPAAAAPASPWRLQVSAITDQAAVRRLVQRIEKAGFKAYLVAGARGVTKVQAGPFATRAAAQAQLAKVKAATGTTPFVTAAP